MVDRSKTKWMIRVLSTRLIALHGVLDSAMQAVARASVRLPLYPSRQS
jgi:hypothetical protein